MAVTYTPYTALKVWSKEASPLASVVTVMLPMNRSPGPYPEAVVC